MTTQLEIVGNSEAEKRADLGSVGFFFRKGGTAVSEGRVVLTLLLARMGMKKKGCLFSTPPTSAYSNSLDGGHATRASNSDNTTRR
jgi:hypothetical protein